ncbi:MAG: phosphoglycerate kinase [Bacteroidales bacterium]|nr:phosphoglycerate kinase [Candidatus Scybalousia scybalohippi]
MKTVKETNFKGKKVLVRVDFNVPFDKQGNISDDTRIQEALPTINKLIADGASVILMAHLVRPKKGGFEPEFTLKPVAEYLSKLIKQEVVFTQSLLGEEVTNLCKNLKEGQVMLLENIRFYPEETKGDVEFAKQLSLLGNAYVNDAFGAAHREHASTATIAQFFPNDKYFGLLMAREVENLNKLMNNHQKPFTAVIGGSKISSKIGILESLLNIVDNLVIGGGMRYTFYKALGHTVGNSLCEDDKIDVAKNLMAKAEEKGVKLYLPEDSIIADDFSENANTKYVATMDIPDGWEGMDIGEKSVKTYTDVVLNSKTILWNGPMGVFEMKKFADGTNAIAKSVAQATQNGAFSAIGGGDSVDAIKGSGYADQVSYISTGGGAMLEFLEGKTLPGIKAIEE